jgi:CheY-like chemotaxis protein
MKHIKKAFIIDDDDILNYVTKELISKFDEACEVTTFTNPEKALNFLLMLNDSKEELPDVLLLDINMPILNGFDFLEQMKTKGLSEKIQVIMYTSSGNPDDKRKSAAFENVVGYMEKPFTAQAYGKILEMTYFR